MIKILRIALAFLLLASPAHAQGIAQLGSGQLWGNSTAARAPAAPTTVTGIIDRAISSTRGTLLTRQASAWVGLAPGTVGLPLLSGGSGADLAYGQVSLSAAVTGTLPLVNGGTNANLTASNGGLLYSTATAGAILAGTATAGQILRSGANAAPSWSGVVIDNSNNILQSTVQEYIIANRLYYIRTDGNDANTGLVNSAGGAWATWQKCATAIAKLYIPTGITASCNAGNSGTWNSVNTTILGWSGNGNVVFTGNTATPGNVILNAVGTSVFNIPKNVRMGVSLTISGFRMATDTVGERSIKHGGDGVIELQNNEFGSQATIQVQWPSARINISGTNAIVGNVTMDKFLDGDAGYIQIQGTLNIAGAVTMTTAFANARFGGFLTDVSTVYNVTGSVTGTRYAGVGSGRIFTGDAGNTVFPGSIDGTVVTGANYDGRYGLKGAVDGSSANAGYVGEVISSTVVSGSAVSLTDNTATNITSISLTAGDWDVSTFSGFLPAATTSITRLETSVSLTSASLDAEPGKYTLLVMNAVVPGVGINPTQSIPARRVNVTSTTTVYMVARARFTVDTLGGFGFLRARRVR